MDASGATVLSVQSASMKVPPKRKGNFRVGLEVKQAFQASMKVPPKRKGNQDVNLESSKVLVSRLNESPSEKEGKCSQPRPGGR